MIPASRLHSLGELIDVALSMAIGTVGPRIFLDTLPLNIDNPRKRGRAWLLCSRVPSPTLIWNTAPTLIDIFG